MFVVGLIPRALAISSTSIAPRSITHSRYSRAAAREERVDSRESANSLISEAFFFTAKRIHLAQRALPVDPDAADQADTPDQFARVPAFALHRWEGPSVWDVG